MKKAEAINKDELETMVPEFDAAKFAENLRKVSSAADRLLNGPIKKDAILILIASKLSDRRQGVRVVEDVLRAAQRLKDYLV